MENKENNIEDGHFNSLPVRLEYSALKGLEDFEFLVLKALAVDMKAVYNNDRLYLYSTFQSIFYRVFLKAIKNKMNEAKMILN